MKLLEVCTSRSWGGMEMRTIKTCELMNGLGHEVKLLCYPDSSLYNEAERKNIKAVTLPFKNGVHPFLIYRLRKIINNSPPDLIHTQFSKDLRFVVPAIEWIKPKIPVVLTKRLGSYIVKKDIFHKYIYSKVDLVTAISRVIKQNVIETCPVDAAKVEIIYNGIDIEKFQIAAEQSDSLRKKMKAEDKIVIGMFGRFSPGKGHEELLYAAKEICGRKKDAKFWIVGEASYGEENYAGSIRKLADKLEITGCVEFLGFREDVPELMSAIDILAVPSHAEAFGNVAVEAMAAGKPVAASNTDGLLDIVVNEETGIQFQPKNSTALADALMKLIDDQEKRKRYGEAGFNRAKEMFDEKKQIKKLEKKFIELIEKPDEINR